MNKTTKYIFLILALPYFDLKEKGFISSYLYLKNKDND
jgi:hypothetical protein